MQFKGLPIIDDFNEIIMKIEDHQGISVEMKERMIEFDSNNHLKGMQFIGKLYQFIGVKKVVKLIYKPYFAEKSKEIIIHPYLLKEFNNRWFLLALHDKKGIIQIYALDRIIKIEPSDIDFKTRDFSTYFNDIIGVSVPKDSRKERVCLRFTNTRFPYIETKPFHNSQKTVRKDSDNTIIQINVKVNQELISSILQFGQDLEVLEPDWLRGEIRKNLGNAIKKY